MVITLAFFSAPSAGVADAYYRMLFEKAVFLLETRMEPRQAIPILQEIIKRHSYDRYYAARSQLYLGLCYKRMGSDQALQAFQEVIINYGDQSKVVKIAEAEIADLKIHEAKEKRKEGKPVLKLVQRFKTALKICDLSNDGRYLAYIDRETGSLSIFDNDRQKARRLSPGLPSDTATGFAERAKISPDTGRVAYSWRNEKGESELRIVGIDGAGTRILLRSKEIAGIHPAGWTARGDNILTVLLGTDRKTQVVLVSPSDHSMSPLVETGLRWPDRVQLSPDGRYLAYGLLTDQESLKRELFLCRIEDKKTTSLLGQAGDEWLIAWRPDGHNLLYACNRSENSGVWVLTVREGEPLPPPRQLTSEIGQIDPIALTKDGTFYFEFKDKDNKSSSATRKVTEIWAWENFLPEASETRTIPDDYPTIQSAVDAANSGDTIFVRKGRYFENIVIAKSLALRGEERKTTIIDGRGSGDVIHITAGQVIVIGITATNGAIGIEIGSGSPIQQVTLKNIVATQNSHFGIRSRNTGGYHLIEDSTFSNNGNFGVDVHQFSRSVIRNCEFFHNGIGLRSGWSWHVLLEGNRIYHNHSGGLTIDSCYYCAAEGNLIYANDGPGINLQYIPSRNTIRDNTLIKNSSALGLYLEWSSIGGNHIYHNDIIENRFQGSKSDRSEARYQFWDNGYPSGGNYWSDYSGRDKDNDGIGDSPHELAVGIKDNFPLMKPRGRLLATLEMDPGARFGPEHPGAWATARIELPAGLPVQDIDLSTLLLNESIALEKGTVSVGDSDDDGVPDLTVNFSGKEAARCLKPSAAAVELVISGKLKNGLPFEARRYPKATGR